MSHGTMIQRVFLTRSLTVEKEGVRNNYGLSIIRTGCFSDSEKHPVLISYEPFVKETEGVEYIDSTVKIRFLDNDLCRIEGLPYQERTFRDLMASSGFCAPKT